MGLTRTSSGLKLRDDFGTDTSGDYDSYSGSPSVSGGELVYPSHTVHKTASGCYCVTSRSWHGSSHFGSAAMWANGLLDDDADVDGYITLVASNLTWALRRLTNNASSALANTNSSVSTSAWYYTRAYRTSTTVYHKGGASALTEVEQSSANTDHAGSFYPGLTYFTSQDKCDWLEGRTSHLITCSGMTEGHYLRVSDGTTAAEAQESSGTATVDAGAVLFPLASVQIRTASGGGGDLIAELDTGDYADMGGGDAFAYSGASAAWLPFMKHNVIGLGGLHG